MVQQCSQSWPIELLARDDIFENADGTCLLQLCDLSRQTLVLCGDARVTEGIASSGHGCLLTVRFRGRFPSCVKVGFMPQKPVSLFVRILSIVSK